MTVAYTHASQNARYIIRRMPCRRRVAWRRLVAALDVAAPADYSDPERAFLDSLPQPYRLIVSVLDTEVWLSVTERSQTE